MNSRKIFIKDRSFVALALIATTASWVIGIGLRNRRRKTGENIALTAPSTPSGMIPHLEPLVTAIQDAAESALTLIELRRLNHWLNSKQWYFAHEQQARTETDASERYENAMADLFRQREICRKEFRGPIDEYCNAIQQTVSEGEYTSPADKVQRERVIEFRQCILQLIEEIHSNGIAPDESA
jgi:hypothetical protein